MSEQGVNFEEVLIAPLEDIVEKIATSIAKAQVALDDSFLQTSTKLNQTNKELADIGYLPPWYHMSEVDLELKMTVHYEKTGETTEGKKYLPFWSPFNAKYKSNFSYTEEGTSLLKIKFASIPPPTALTSSTPQ